MIFAELVRSGQRNAETEQRQLVWVISEPAGRVSSLCFISASSAPNTDGENQEGEGGEAKRERETGVRSGTTLTVVLEQAKHFGAKQCSGIMQN